MLIHLMYRFSPLIIWLKFSIIPTFLVIFHRKFTIIWAIWYLPKYMRSSCLVWWFIFNLFFRSCHLFTLPAKTQYKIPMWNTFRLLSNIYEVDIILYMDWYLILLRTIWIYLISAIRTVSLISLNVVFLVIDLNFTFCIDIY